MSQFNHEFYKASHELQLRCFERNSRQSKRPFQYPSRKQQRRRGERIVPYREAVFARLAGREVDGTVMEATPPSFTADNSNRSSQPSRIEAMRLHFPRFRAQATTPRRLKSSWWPNLATPSIEAGDWRATRQTETGLSPTWLTTELFAEARARQKDEQTSNRELRRERSAGDRNLDSCHKLGVRISRKSQFRSACARGAEARGRMLRGLGNWPPGRDAQRGGAARGLVQFWREFELAVFRGSAPAVPRDATCAPDGRSSSGPWQWIIDGRCILLLAGCYFCLVSPLDLLLFFIPSLCHVFCRHGD